MGHEPRTQREARAQEDWARAPRGCSVLLRGKGKACYQSPSESMDLGHGPTAQGATSPATPAQQAWPGAPTCSVGCT